LRETLARALSPATAASSSPLRVEEMAARPAAIIGISEPMQEVFRLIEKAKVSRAPGLIQGESGTGKELVARAISQGGPSEGKLVVVNCCALSDSLIESELFGHARGSFSGALGDREGLFETADGGTLFLDEIGDIPPRSQAKLLRVLQEGELRRVGENRLRHVQVRILAATNRNLREAIDHRQFREDLYYRLNVIPVYLPPLRERPSDIPSLATHFLHKHRRKGATNSLSEAAVSRLQRYPFPGNIRELENVMQRAVSLARSAVITERDIEACLQSPDPGQVSVPAFAGRTYPELKHHLRSLERDFLGQCLRAHGFRVSDAAKSLGVARTALHNRIKALEIKTQNEGGKNSTGDGRRATGE
jgi:transcriptional regulator with GAF, ATPase, and Fis domain